MAAPPTFDDIRGTAFALLETCVPSKKIAAFTPDFREDEAGQIRAAFLAAGSRAARLHQALPPVFGRRQGLMQSAGCVIRQYRLLS